jgi:hypothetical protein
MLIPAAGTRTFMTNHESAAGENDVPTDTATATSRATGGRDPGTGPDAPQDRHSTTGTTSNDTPVGRVSGDETGDTDQSGGERAAGRPQDAHDGALRDE